MKIIICLITSLLLTSSNILSQSEINFEGGTSITVDAGADICADTVIINGSFSIGGTICGSSLLQLNLTAFIEGFYNSSANNTVSDTVNVFLRSATAPYALTDSSTSTLNSSGNGTFYFANVINGANYFVVLKHRNSIETWSFAGNAFAAGTLDYNFTTAADKAYGSNQIQVNNSPLKFAVYSGDVNQDGFVNLTDVIGVHNDVSSFITGYVSTDVNGDNIVDLTDLLITHNNSTNFVSIKRP